MIKLDTIKVNPDNPRWISETSFEGLKKSIKRDPKFLKYRAVVVDKDRVVKAGNQRLRALLELGYIEVPDEWIINAEDLSEEELKRFMFIDNPPKGMSGAYDNDILANDYEVPELIDIGFSPEELGIDTELPEKESNTGGNINNSMATCPACGTEFDPKKK